MCQSSNKLTEKIAFQLGKDGVAWKKKKERSTGNLESAVKLGHFHTVFGQVPTTFGDVEATSALLLGQFSEISTIWPN